MDLWNLCNKFQDEEIKIICYQYVEKYYKKSSPHKSDILYWIAVFFELSGHQKEACTCLREILQQTAMDHQEAFYKYLLCYPKSSRKLDKFHNLLEKYKRKWPDDPRIYVFQGDAYLERKMHSEAIKSYYRAIQKDSTCADAFAGRGDVKSELREYSKSREDYLKALDLDKNCLRAKQGIEKLNIL